MRSFRRVFKNTGILYVRMAVTVFFALYTTRIVLGALGVEDFGIFNLVGSAIAMLTFLNSSMAAATQRYMSFANGQQDQHALLSVFNTSMMIHAALAACVYLILFGAGYILFDGVFKISPARLGAAQFVYQAAAFAVVFSIVSVPYDAVITARENMMVFAILSVMESALKLGIALHIAGITDDRLVRYSFWMAGVALFSLVAKAVYCHARYAECHLAPRRAIEKTLLKSMSAFAGWSFLGSSSSLVSHYGQGLVANTFFGTSVNAAQGIAAQISGQLGAFAGTMLKALNPLIVKSEGAGDRPMMVKATMVGSKLGFFLLMIFYVPVLIEMPYIFDLWLKVTPEFAVVFCRLLMVRNLIEQLFTTLTASIAAVGDIKAYQIWSSMLTLLPLPASYFLLNAGWPAYTMYVVYIVYALLASAMILFYASRSFGCSVPEYLHQVVGRCMAAFAGCLVLAGLPTLFMMPGIGRLLLVCLLSVLMFCISVWFVGLAGDERIPVRRGFEAIRKRMGLKPNS